MFDFEKKKQIKKRGRTSEVRGALNERVRDVT